VKEEGIRVLAIKNHYKELVHALIGVNIGWRHEPKGRKGISHFIEHLIFEGNEEYPEPDEFARKFGVKIEGATLFDRTVFYFTSRKRDWKEILRMFLSIIFHPSLEKRFDEIKESEILPATVKESEYTPWHLAYEWAHNLVFSTDFRESLGTEEDIRKLTTEDLKDWHRRYFHLKDSFVILSGDVSEEEVKNVVSSVNPQEEGELAENYRVSWEYQYKELKRDTKNFEMVFGARVEFHPGWKIVEALIGGCVPVKKEWKNTFGKYVYSMETKIKNNLKDTGIFLYFGATSEENAKKIDSTLLDFLKEMKIKDEEVELAKRIVELEVINAIESGEDALFETLGVIPTLEYDLSQFLSQIKKIDTKKIEELKDILWGSLKYKVVVSSSK